MCRYKTIECDLNVCTPAMQGLESLLRESFVGKKIGLTFELGTYLDLTTFAIEVNRQGMCYNVEFGCHFTLYDMKGDTSACTTAVLQGFLTIA